EDVPELACRDGPGFIPHHHHRECSGSAAGDCHQPERNRSDVMNRLRYRKAVNYIMLTATGVCTCITVSCLFVILGYLVYNGGKSVDWNFFTKLPLPPGEVGGGMANAIVGSATMVGLASLIGLPVGFMGGVYLAEFSGKTMAFTVRYLADLLNGVPSIVIGIFAYAVVVAPMHRFSALAGAFALSLMLIPVTLRSTEQ